MPAPLPRAAPSSPFFIRLRLPPLPVLLHCIARTAGSS
uniref:Uncharacterized protein n=1 Tax=Arundo donax TaxID=35708 RepID=A0A0A9C9F3_ARUDO